MPVTVVVATVIVTLELPEPGAEMGLGEKLTVTPDGWPDADKVIAELKPLRTAVVIVDAPVLPWATDTVDGEADMVNVGDVDAPTSAVIRPAPFMLPQPVARSNPVTAG